MLQRLATSFRLALATGFLMVAAQAQVFVGPDSDTVNAGGAIHVDNWTDGACLIVITDAAGNVIETITLAPWGWVDIPVPGGAAMIGQKITTTAKSTTGDSDEQTHRVVQ